MATTAASGVIDSSNAARLDGVVEARSASADELTRQHRAVRNAGLREGIRAASPLLVPVIAMGVSFGVLAEPVMGAAPTIVMSIVVQAGAAQFATVGALSAGASTVPAVVAGLLMNLRFIPMGAAVAPSLPGRRWVRGLQGLALAEASLVISRSERGRFNRFQLVGATVPQAVGWVTGTTLGVLLGSFIDPRALGLDALFPAFYLLLLLPELRGPRALHAAALSVALTLAVVPLTPPGVPLLVACGAALIGLRR
jgi:predicted branched-subunit amino acid permease